MKTYLLLMKAAVQKRCHPVWILKCIADYQENRIQLMDEFDTWMELMLVPIENTFINRYLYDIIHCKMVIPEMPDDFIDNLRKKSWSFEGDDYDDD